MVTYIQVIGFIAFMIVVFVSIPTQLIRYENLKEKDSFRVTEISGTELILQADNMEILVEHLKKLSKSGWETRGAISTERYGPYRVIVKKGAGK
jgi:membrane-bound acyltransferase YfiQ involved in biofilm formation